MVDIERRHLFRRGVTKNKSGTVSRRLPWVANESLFIDGCTRCGQCITACETKVITVGDGGFPQVDFSQGECTFCYQCAEACPEPLFAPRGDTPWHQTVVIEDMCLAQQGVECRSCGDMCDYSAIKFRLQIGGSAIPQLSEQDCTGCGACIKPCPSGAIKMKTGSEHELPRE